jgi:hypothetical protein
VSPCFLTTLVCRAEEVPAYSKSLFSPKKAGNQHRACLHFFIVYFSSNIVYIELMTQVSFYITVIFGVQSEKPVKENTQPGTDVQASNK